MAYASRLSSSEDEISITVLVRQNVARGPDRNTATNRSNSPELFVSGDTSQDDQQPTTAVSSLQAHPRKRKCAAVEIVRPKDFCPDDYAKPKGADTVVKVISRVEHDTEVMYETRFADKTQYLIPHGRLISSEYGKTALTNFRQGVNSSSASEDEEAMVTTRRTRTAAVQYPGMINTNAIELSGDEEGLNLPPRKRARKSNVIESEDEDLSMISDEDPQSSQEYLQDNLESGPRRSRRVLQLNQSRNSRYATRSARLRPPVDVADSGNEDDESPLSDEGSDTIPSDGPGWRHSKKRKQIAPKTQLRLHLGGTSHEGAYNESATRRSERSTRFHKSMQEIGENQIERSSSEEMPRTQAQQRPSGAREAFKPLPRGNPFRARHSQVCDTCGNANNTSAALIYCQGCSMAYHKNCIGPRGNRDHLVTKIDDEDFVLQCRRCINSYRKKDILAPDLSVCQDCRQVNPSCVPFRVRKTMLQEQKEREENNGEDPVTEVDPVLINNSGNVLFRCMKCSRAFHYHHLPPLDPYAMDHNGDDWERGEARHAEYGRNWNCKDCIEAPAKVSSIIAWRPVDPETYNPGVQVEFVDEDEKEYLIKWEGLSYFKAEWKPGAWVWGVTQIGTRRSFFKKDPQPKMRTEDAIPEEYLRIDIVLDVRYTNRIDYHTDEIDRARIKEVDKALLKYKGLGYEDAVWETVPSSDDGERWTDFVAAYNDWVLGRYTHVPKGQPLKTRLEKARAQEFTKLEKKKQPENLVGGELMKYQIDGLNWLYYQWYQHRNGILADEMGLGKTIQVIAFLAMMMHDHHCWPFLIVVPNSTCPNWRREIEQWAPALRVVTYYGSAQAREMAYKYEMFPSESRDLRCHIVVTSYEAATDESCRKFFKSVPWQGLIVDEGQRLKNDKSLLHNALVALKVPFRILLTGTPLQNNARELFNLLQFLDDSIDAEKTEQEYAEMTNEKIAKLHDLIRPFILRRTKAQVLTFLPPMAQVIVPLSMSVLQQTLYKSILAKNPDLIRSIFTHNALKPAERASLNNILMQLRKCLCHPFVYSREIEESHHSAAVLHRNLVEASSKLQFLEVLLPKLHERGHRVLIFSQFLDMLTILEDFLDGLQFRHQRLDGSVSSLEKQKRIDEFNAPGSPLFAFLLSTRAGGVGINLATADTVIIVDPDFNPHQDIQAISRAHRIGQTKKVLCFQLMTRASAEEKIIQIGRKKIALDHVVIEEMDAEDLEEKDVESILRHGASELFKDGDPEQEIKYDAASIDKLLDRSQIENTKAGADNSAESQFSFARVWANDQSVLTDSFEASDEENAPDPSVWDKILKERAAAAAAEAAARAEAYGRGRRAKAAVDYAAAEAENEALQPDIESPEVGVRPPGKFLKGRKSRKVSDDSDTDFMASSSEEESATELAPEAVLRDAMTSADQPSSQAPGGILSKPSAKQNISPVKVKKPQPPIFKRCEVQPPRMPPSIDLTTPQPDGTPAPQIRPCRACGQLHPVGSCPLKIAGVENCPLCGIAHFGHSRVCPHIKSETQVVEMLFALKRSPEPRHIVEAAVKYLRGVKGTLVQAKKQARERAEKMKLAGQGAVNHSVEERLLAAWERERR